MSPHPGPGSIPRFLVAWLLPVLAGGLHALAFLPELTHRWPIVPTLVQVLAWLGLIWSLSQAASPREGAWRAWLFGLVWLSGGTAWLFVSLHRYGGLPAWLAVVSIGLLSAALSIYLAAAGGLWVRWRRRRWLPDAVLWAALWLLVELARAWVLTGFPWAASAYALLDSPWVGLAPWLGMYGMGMVAMAAVAMPALAWCLRQAVWPACLASAVLVGLSVLAAQPSFVTPVGPPLQVALVQGNIPQDEKFAIQRQVEALGWHAQQLAAARADLVVIPETAIPLLPADLPPGFWDGLLGHFHSAGNAALVGVPLGSLDAGYTNSVVGISAATRQMPQGIYRYNKHHLVPFGEFIPWGFHWFVRLMNIPLGDFSRGPLKAPSFQVKGQWVAPNICYEDLFGEELAARFVGGNTPAPTILANVSNLAWFGRQVAIGQHLQVARLRSIELQRPTIRATNTGATVALDHRGRVLAMLPFNERGVLQAQVQGMQGLTPFAQWAGRWGLWPLLALGLGLIAVCKSRRKPDGT